MPMGPVQEGLAQRMAGGAPPAPPMPAGPPPGPGGMQMQGPPGMEQGGGDPVQRLAEALGEARMAIGEMGPERFATEGKDLLRGFVGSVTQLQMEMSGGGQGMPAGQGPGPQGMPPGPGAPPPQGMPLQQGPPPAPPGFPTGP